jgi:hypothetical protein
MTAQDHNSSARDQVSHVFCPMDTAPVVRVNADLAAEAPGAGAVSRGKNGRALDGPESYQ